MSYMTQQNLLYLQTAQFHIFGPRWMAKINFLYTFISTHSPIKNIYVTVEKDKNLGWRK